jgi:periplasmic mercuric ion binding protein
MKNLKIFIAVLATVVATMTFAQKKEALKTTNIKVYGNCESCKARIEKTAMVDGVSKATWNKGTKMLTLVYDPSRVTTDQVQKKIAAVGYDTEKEKAPDAAYNTLHACCKYRK